MKNLITLVVLLMTTLSSFAQSPQNINYQAVVRNNAGDVIKNQSVRFRLSVTEGANGISTYSETHQTTTNALGLVNLSIGTGTVVSGTFVSINWANGGKFLKVEVDAAGGTNYTLMGSQQLVSVPYALHATTANSVLNQWQNNLNGIHYNLGKIGIGTVLPGFKLTLQGDESGVYDGAFDPRSFINIRNNSAGQYATANTQLFCGSTTFTKLEHVSPNYVISDFADHGQVWASGKGLILRASPTSASDPTATAIKFMTGYRADGGSNERMKITADGNVGIGTSDPKAKLHLEGNTTGNESTVYDAREYLHIQNNSNSIGSAASLSITAGSNAGSTYLWHVAPSYTPRPQDQDFTILYSSGKGMSFWNSPKGNTANGGYFKFQTGVKPDNTGGFDRLVINNVGNVGIGNSDPKAKLEVKDGDVYVNDPTKGIILKSPNGSCWRVTIDNTGNFVRTAITCPN